jgi:hypothetical protein
MLRRTVAPCPSDWDKDNTFLTTFLGLSNGAAADEAAADDAEDEDMMAGGNKKTAVTTRIRIRSSRKNRRGLELALLLLELELVFLDARGTRWLFCLVRRASAV